jgi:hypothetical protein
MKLLPVLLALAMPAVMSDKRDITVLRRDATHPNEYALMPHLSPIVFVRQVGGHSLTEKRDLSCHWSQSIDLKSGLPNVVGDCDGDVKLVITGIDLNY